MSKYVVVGAVLALAACGSKSSQSRAADSAAAAAPAPAVMAADTTHKDTTKVAGDTAKKQP